MQIAPSLLLAGLVTAAAPALPQHSTPEAPTFETQGLPSAHCLGFLPRGLTSFGTAVDSGWLYVLGGYFGEPHAYSRDGQSTAFLRINLLDPRDVRDLGDVEPVQGAELVRVGGELVRVGGLHARNADGEAADLVSTDRVRAWSPVTGAWRDLPPLPHARSSHRAVAIGNRLYVVGGWNLQPEGRTWCEELHVLDLGKSDPAWRTAAVPFRARALGAAEVGGQLVVVGGIRPDRGVSDAVWVLDTETEEWREGPAFPDWGFGVSATSNGAEVLCAGRSGTVLGLDPRSEDASWTPRATLRHGRIFHELRCDGPDALVALGGIVGMGTDGRVRQIERIDLSTAAAPRIERFSVPAPVAAKSRFALMRRGRSVLLFGGNRGLRQHGFDADDFSDEAWRFDFGTHEWTRLATLPSARQSMRVAGAGEVALVVGGFAPGRDGDAAASQASTWIYDPEFDDWREGPTLPAGRSQFAAVPTADGTLLFGGADYDPNRPREERFVLHSDVLVAAPGDDGSTAEVAAAPHGLPRERRAFASAVLDGRLYLVGGLGASFDTVEEVDVLDLGTGAWSVAPPPPLPRVGGDLVALGGALYLAGGSERTEDGLEPSRRVLRFVPGAERWEVAAEDIGIDTKHARAFELDGRLCVLTLHREGTGRCEYVLVDVQGPAH